jgi:hypothetical protein
LVSLLKGLAAPGLGEALREHVLQHYDWRDKLARVEAILEGRGVGA